MGCSPIICGPGSIDLAHQPDDFINFQKWIATKILGSVT